MKKLILSISILVLTFLWIYRTASPLLKQSHSYTRIGIAETTLDTGSVITKNSSPIE